MTSSSERLDRRFVLTIFAAVLAIKKCFWPLLSTVKVFYREQWSNLDQYLPAHKSENRDKRTFEDICQCVSLRRSSQTILRLNRWRDMFVCRKYASGRLFTVKTLFFPKICTFEFMLHGGKPTLNWFFPRRSMWPIDQIKYWFQLWSAVAPESELRPK